MKEDKDYDEEWNELHCKYVNEGDAEYRNNKMADYCENLIVKAKNAYYNTDDPIMSDYMYDKIEHYLEILRPDSEYLKKVVRS